MLNADNLATALTQGSSAWMVASVAAVLPILWSFTLILHFSRPYVIRFLMRLTLRFGGDVWWLSYVLMRDALMAITLGLSMIFLMPNLYLKVGLPITAPIATLVLFWALVLKLLRDDVEDGREHQEEAHEAEGRRPGVPRQPAQLAQQQHEPG